MGPQRATPQGQVLPLAYSHSTAISAGVRKPLGQVLPFATEAFLLPLSSGLMNGVLVPTVQIDSKRLAAAP